MAVQVKSDLERQDVELTEEPTPGIDLNQADAKTLTRLPGIGPTLAARIIEHRETEGPFLLKEDLMDVPGIADTLYAQVQDRLEVTVPTAAELAIQEVTEPEEDVEATAADEAATPPPLPEQEPEAAPETASQTASQTASETAPEAEPEDEAAPDEDAPALSSATAPKREPPAGIEHAAPPVEADMDDIPLPDDDAYEEREIPWPEDEAAPETAAPAAPKEHALPWLWPTLLSALLGGLLGVFFSILVFAGINGSIDIGQTRAMQDLRGEFTGITVELDAIRTDVSALQGDVRGIRERVEVLSGLTARMEEAENAVETLNAETEALQEDTTALQSAVEKLGFDINSMAETLETVETQTEKSMTFFERLGTLLQEVFEAEPQGSAPSDQEVDG